MFKAILVLASIFSVCAFNVAPRASLAPVSLKMSFENEAGVLPPTGFWDPLGLSKGLDAAAFEQRRTAELKHGRVAMLAVVGLLVADIARFPGTIDLDGTTFQSIPNGLDAFKVIPAFGWFQIAASIGYWEIFGWKRSEGGSVGDFGFGAEYLSAKFNGGATKEQLLTKELQNGRLAMIGAAELLVHDYATNGGLFDLSFF
eukprot:gene11169-14988_t